MGTPSPHTQQFPSTDYGDYARSEYRDFFVPSTVAPNIHWLRAVLNPLQQPKLDETILPSTFGVSLLGIEGSRLILKWSTCFEEHGDSIVYQGPGNSAPSNIVEDLSEQIDELCATSNAQILVVHCLSDGSGPAVPANTSIVPGSTIEDLIDMIGARLNLNPRFFVEHFSTDIIGYHEPIGQILPSEKDYVNLSHPDGGYITATSGSANLPGTSMGMHNYISSAQV